MNDRKMPNPWFTASASASPIHALTMPPWRETASGERALGPFILPSFQRPAVWTPDQQIKLVESLWDGLPIGSYVVNEAIGVATDAWLLDGQQRITAIIAYMAGEFPVYGWRFPDLDKAKRRGFWMRPIGTLTSKVTDEDACREIYDRLAYGGTPHEPKAAEPGREGRG